MYSGACSVQLVRSFLYTGMPVLISVQLYIICRILRVVAFFETGEPRSSSCQCNNGSESIKSDQPIFFCTSTRDSWCTGIMYQYYVHVFPPNGHTAVKAYFEVVSLSQGVGAFFVYLVFAAAAAAACT